MVSICRDGVGINSYTSPWALIFHHNGSFRRGTGGGHGRVDVLQLLAEGVPMGQIFQVT